MRYHATYDVEMGASMGGGTGLWAEWAAGEGRSLVHGVKALEFGEETLGCVQRGEQFQGGLALAVDLLVFFEECACGEAYFVEAVAPMIVADECGECIEL